MANGLSHDNDGVIDPVLLNPVYTSKSATAAKTASVTISMPSKRNCVHAESSIPTTQMVVRTAIQMTPTNVTA